MFDRAGRALQAGFISGPRRRFERKFGQAGMPRGATGEWRATLPRGGTASRKGSPDRKNRKPEWRPSFRTTGDAELATRRFAVGRCLALEANFRAGWRNGQAI
jgi:hypothetical protein